VASHFVAGLGHLQAGNLDEAATEFRNAVRAAPDFLPAVAYLGACYAAGGKDKEAASAWQTALLRDRESPWLQRLAIEAWLRAERPAAALALIKQARQRFPEDDSFVRLQARAELAAGRPREALEIVESINEPDESLLFMALASLYAATRDHAPVWDTERDLAAMQRWRDAYAAINGASLSLVDAWMAEVSSAR
jgi:predicted Zn-dependent protease